MGGMTGGSGRVGRGGDACEGVVTWLDGQVGSVVMGSMVVGSVVMGSVVGSVVMWQRGHGATSSWGSVVVVVSKGGTHHQCDACDVSLPAPLAAAAAVTAACRGRRQR